MQITAQEMRPIVIPLVLSGTLMRFQRGSHVMAHGKRPLLARKRRGLLALLRLVDAGACNLRSFLTFLGAQQSFGRTRIVHPQRSRGGDGRGAGVRLRGSCQSTGDSGAP